VTKETAAGATTATETGRWTYAYDAAGNCTSETDRVTNKQRKVLAFAPGGEVLEGVDAENVRFRYIREPRGQVREHHYGVASAKLVAAAGGIINSPNGYVARYTYDGNGRLTNTQRSNASSITFCVLRAGGGDIRGGCTFGITRAGGCCGYGCRSINANPDWRKRLVHLQSRHDDLARRAR
jgi:YD repeat-containing protein